MVQSEEEDGDGDIVISSTKQSFICPLTRARFVDPMKNTACGHSYSSSAINSILRGYGSSCPCPISGCVKSVSAAGLRADSEMVSMMERVNNKIF